MSGTGHISYPTELVDTLEEKLHIWYVYGRDAERAGFRKNMPLPSTYTLMDSGLFTECSLARASQQQSGATQSGATQSEQGQEQQAGAATYESECGTFRIDRWTAPIWLPIRDTDVTDLPPR